MTRILAIDPATQCGWAIGSSETDLVGGTFDLSVRRDESGGMRLVRFRGKLRDLLAVQPIDLLVYEAARHAAPSMQSGLVVQATLQGVLSLWAEDSKIEYRGYSPSEIKKFATGKGNANKAAMMAAARERFGPVKDDNHADALWIWALAMRDYGNVPAAV